MLHFLCTLYVTLSWQQVLENEDVALRQLRDRLGPYAAEDALLYHLRASRGKLNWAGEQAGCVSLVDASEYLAQDCNCLTCVAVNTYFRAVLADQTAPTDFQPKHYAQLSSTSNAAFMSSSRPDDVKAPQTLEQIPNAICEHILQYTDLLTVCNARAACRSLKTVRLSTVHICACTVQHLQAMMQLLGMSG